jgi:transglutaminase-like putative cysteine protease
MNLYRYFLTSSYSLLAISFAMLIATGRCDKPAMALFAGALVAGWLIDTGRLAWAVKKRVADGLMLAGLALAAAEWRLLGVELVSAVIHLTLFASSLKLLRVKNGRDWLWLYLVSFCLALMTAGMMAGAGFLLLLACYLFAGLSTLVSHEIRQTQLDFAASHAAGNPGAAIRLEADFWRETRRGRRKIGAPRGRILLLASCLSLAAILLLAAPLFLVMPRMARAGARSGLLGSQSVSGFNETVRLGEVAQVKLSPRVVMRVRVSHSAGETPHPLRWRGVTLDYYDGQSWSQSQHERTRIRRVGDGFKVDDRVWMRGFTEQRFFLEPLDIRVLFAAPRPVIVSGPRELERDAGGGLWSEDHSYFKFDYTVYSDTFVPSDVELAQDNSRDYPRDINARYLQTPHDHDLRINELAAQVTQGAATPIETARRIETHLRERYGYTLDLKRVEDGDPVADFLFNVKAGHCEYFASAMVLMLRARRIPARLVNGFQTGEYNPSADVFTVRQSDAHSWVEAYFPKQGWVSFDPTPPAGLSVYDDGLAAMLRQYAEAMEMYWLEHVVGFDTDQQLSMARAARTWLAAARFDFNSGSLGRWLSGLSMPLSNWLARFGDAGRARTAEPGNERDVPDGPRPSDPAGSTGSQGWARWRDVGIALAALVALAGLALFRRGRRQSWRRRAGRDAVGSAIAFYREMLGILERAGHRRQPHQTPSEFAAQLAMPGVSEITRLYERARFGREPLRDDDLTRITERLRELKTQSRKRFPFSFFHF